VKTKLLEALKTKNKTLGFSDKALDGVAEYLSKSVTKDEEVDATVAGAEPLLKAFQGDLDKRVTDAIVTAKAQWEKENSKPPTKKEETKTEKKEIGDEPEWVKSIKTSIEAMTSKVTAIEQVNLMQGQHSKIKAKFEEAKVPEIYFGKLMAGKTFKDDAEIETFTNEIVTGWEQIKQINANEGLGQTHIPLLGGKQQDGVSSKVQEYINAKTKKTDAKDSLGGKKLIQE